MTRTKNFRWWLVDALADLVRMQDELDDANRSLRDAEEVRRKSLRQIPSGTGDKRLRGRIRYAELRYRTVSERERLMMLVDKCKACVLLQRERIVQAWQRHADRAAKRYAQATDTERHRVMREIAGIYAVFCMVDIYAVCGDVYIGFVYDAFAKAASRRKASCPYTEN